MYSSVTQKVPRGIRLNPSAAQAVTNTLCRHSEHSEKSLLQIKRVRALDSCHPEERRSRDEGSRVRTSWLATREAREIPRWRSG